MTEKNEIFWPEIGPVFGEQGSPQEFQGVLSSFFYHFSLNLISKTQELYLDRATMRAKEFSVPFTIARGHHTSSLFLQTN